MSCSTIAAVSTTPRPIDVLLNRLVDTIDFLSRLCPVLKLELKSFLEFVLYKLLVEFVGVDAGVDICMRDNESMFFVRCDNESRLGFGIGELFDRVGVVVTFDDIGMDELRPLLLSDESFRML